MQSFKHYLKCDMAMHYSQTTICHVCVCVWLLARDTSWIAAMKNRHFVCKLPNLMTMPLAHIIGKVISVSSHLQFDNFKV